MLDSQQTVASVVLDHSECAPVFQRHRIDYCCRGETTIAAACEKLGLSTDSVLAQLSDAIDARGPASAADDVRALSTAALVARIVERHHTYLRTALPFVGGLAVKVARVHGDRDARLREISAIAGQLSDVLLPHLDEEENELFPHLLAATVDLALVRGELTRMREEHLVVGALLQRVRRATEDFHRPEWACNSYRTLLAELENLETDVLVHVHLENHELMPRFMGSEPTGAPRAP
jgi:regulator of cell morphogenesis and NO signaling